MCIPYDFLKPLLKVKCPPAARTHTRPDDAVERGCAASCTCARVAPIWSHPLSSSSPSVSAAVTLAADAMWIGRPSHRCSAITYSVERSLNWLGCSHAPASGCVTLMGREHSRHHSWWSLWPSTSVWCVRVVRVALEPQLGRCSTQTIAQQEQAQGKPWLYGSVSFQRANAQCVTMLYVVTMML